ncbi:MAG: GNAT family N-acetyltransferase [Bacillota bacterium]|nr:MAG: GNAT family N-acetyltransferase [Bacillota bacterium]
MDFLIEPFRPSDIPEALELWRQVPGVGLGRGDTPPLLRVFLRWNEATSFVARFDGRMVGAVLGGWDGRRGYIHHLAVRPDCQGRGLGTALLDKTLASLGSLGALKVHMFVHVNNAKAIEFYRRNGWVWRDDLGMMSRDL